MSGRTYSRLAWVLALVLGLSGCGGGSSSGTIPPDVDSPPPSGEELDTALRTLATTLELTGDPAAPRGVQQRLPSEDPLLKLGQILFFSNTMSGLGESSCATCHHPDLAGADGLSISIGVAPQDARTTGLDRKLDPSRDRDPLADGGPNMHRNSPTVFNSALFDRALTYDGRVFVIDDEVSPGGKGQAIRTPESGNAVDLSGVDGLLAVMSKFPMTNENEMRGYYFTELNDPEQFRHRLVLRLQGIKDKQFMTEGAADRWLALFRAAYGTPTASAEEVITVPNMQRALGAFLESLIFVDTPWKRYLAGDQGAIAEAAKRGAKLFLAGKEDGGMGCAACHSGDFFTNEQFFNTGFPQIGRGFRRADRDDIGRWASTRIEADRYAFRVPSLLNVAQTAPYGHAGSFASLEQLIRYHADPRSEVEQFDFSLAHLPQYQDTGISYPRAEANTRTTLAEPSFLIAEALLPGRTLDNQEIADLVAFLETLTDTCVLDSACINRWTPDVSEDPDGFLFVRNQNPIAIPEPPDYSVPNDYPAEITLNFQATTARSTFPDTQGCENGLDTALNTGNEAFVPRHFDPTFGLANMLSQMLDKHLFSYATWYRVDSVLSVEATMIAGGVTATYLDDDCWPDLVYPAGDGSEIAAYLNDGSQAGFNRTSLLPETATGRPTGIAVADLNGDYRRELVIGNLHDSPVLLYAQDDANLYYKLAELPMVRHSYGISFADYNDDDYLEFYIAHWGGIGIPGSAPVFWLNAGGAAVKPFDDQARISAAYIDQHHNFTPKFADFTGNGYPDLVIAADFRTSMMLRNDGLGVFENVTDRSVLTDENGMGSTLGDFDNDGKVDWFVTSVLDPGGVAEATWGVTGNRLYRNVSTTDTLKFEDITQSAGVRNGNWGWGACAADFNNDGWLDIFHVNGFGYIPPEIYPDGAETYIMDFFAAAASEFIGVTPRLFINQGGAIFTEQSLDWGIVLPSEGRGLTCFDYDRDGDLDIALLDHSTGLQFYSNQVGHGPGRQFLNVRLVGAPPNTDAIGARVQVRADVDGNGVQQLTRISEANSNFNSQNLPDLHFGLGQATSIESLSIAWPNGSRWSCGSLASNQFLVFDQRDPAAHGCTVTP